MSSRAKTHELVTIMGGRQINPYLTNVGTESGIPFVARISFHINPARAPIGVKLAPMLLPMIIPKILMLDVFYLTHQMLHFQQFSKTILSLVGC